MLRWTRIIAGASFTIIMLHLVSLYVLTPDPRGSVCLGCILVELEKLLVFAVIILISCLHLIHFFLGKRSLPKGLKTVSAITGYMALVCHITVSLIIVRAVITTWNSELEIPGHLHCLVSTLESMRLLFWY
jgi:hypothetical protein